MIFRIVFGGAWNHFFLAAKGHGEETPAITVDLSMRYFGFCVPVLHGEICPQIMETGKIHTAAFADGEIKEFGSEFWRH
jgi:hypothetical protein